MVAYCISKKEQRKSTKSVKYASKVLETFREKCLDFFNRFLKSILQFRCCTVVSYIVLEFYIILLNLFYILFNTYKHYIMMPTAWCLYTLQFLRLSSQISPRLLRIRHMYIYTYIHSTLLVIWLSIVRHAELKNHSANRNKGGR